MVGFVVAPVQEEREMEREEMEREEMEQEDTQGQLATRLPRRRGMSIIMMWASCRCRSMMLGCIVSI